MNKTVFYLSCLLVILSTSACQSGYAAADDANDQKPLVLILFGPPGSGQGVLAVKISKAFSMPLVSIADLVHDNIKEETEIGQQTRECLAADASIPDSLILQMLREYIYKKENPNGFILEGIPRTIGQAQELQKILDKDYKHQAISINISDEAILSQAAGRFICQDCGRVYHQELSPPDEGLICNHCDNPLTQREDDSPENVKKSIHDYRNRMEPIVQFYKSEGLLTEVNNSSSFNKTFAEIKEIGNQL